MGMQRYGISFRVFNSMSHECKQCNFSRVQMQFFSVVKIPMSNCWLFNKEIFSSPVHAYRVFLTLITLK